MRISDWSSDVCSSDLPAPPGHPDQERTAGIALAARGAAAQERAARIDQSRPIPGPGRAPEPDRRRRGPADARPELCPRRHDARSEEHTSELQSLMRISYAVFCLKKKKTTKKHNMKVTHRPYTN